MAAERAPDANSAKTLRQPLPPKAGRESGYVTASQAAAVLGIKPATLYSYVSRGVIRSLAMPGQRARLYYREDVERATKRLGGRAGAKNTAEAVLSWGQPLFQSSITAMTTNGPVYRGRPAVALADEGRSFESVAELLWTGVDQPSFDAWAVAPLPSGLLPTLAEVLKGVRAATPLRVMSAATALMALQGDRLPDYERGSTVADARRLLVLYADAMALIRRRMRLDGALTATPFAQRLLLSLGGRLSPRACSSLNIALVLCADHELSPPTLAARVAASCGRAGKSVGGPSSRCQEIGIAEMAFV